MFCSNDTPKFNRNYSFNVALERGRRPALAHKQDQGARHRQRDRDVPLAAVAEPRWSQVRPGLLAGWPAGVGGAASLAARHPPRCYLYPLSGLGHLSRNDLESFPFPKFPSRCSVPVQTNIWASFQNRFSKNIQLRVFQRNY